LGGGNVLVGGAAMSKRGGWIGGEPDQWEIEDRHHLKRQLDAISHKGITKAGAAMEEQLREELTLLRLERSKVKGRILLLCIDLRDMAAAEEKNGNYKTADVLRDVVGRVAALGEPGEGQDK
jgi:hypothetical protein